MLALGWGLAAVLGAVAGLMAEPAEFVLQPTLMQPILLYAFAAAVLGGLESPVGAVVGGLALGVFLNLVGQYVHFVTSELRLPFAFAVLLARAAREADRALRPQAGAQGMRPRAAAVGTAAAAAVVLALLPFTLSGYHQALAAQVAIFFIAILGLNILTGYTGQISIGHGAFMAIGGYTTAVLSRDHHTNLVLTMLVAFAICFLCGLLVGLPALRLSGVYLALATFALAVSVPQIPLKFSKYLGGSGGVQSAKTVSHLWLYGDELDRARRSSSCSPGSCCAAGPAARSAPSATARWPRPRPASGCPSTRRSRSASRPRSPAWRARSSCWARTGSRSRASSAILLSLQILVGAAVAGLGSLWGVLAGAAFVGLLPTISSDVPVIGSTPRPGRRLRRDRDRRHAPAPHRGRRPRPAPPPAAGAGLDSRFNSPIKSDPRASYSKPYSGRVPGRRVKRRARRVVDA